MLLRSVHGSLCSGASKRCWPILVCTSFCFYLALCGPPNQMQAQRANQQPDGGKKPIMQEIRYIWPVALSEEPFVFPGDTFHSALAKIGQEGFDKYVKQILPKELEADAQFAADFAKGDSGRLNAAFRRWQKKIWSIATKINLAEIDWDGKLIPKVKGVTYKWPELYQSDAYEEFYKRVSEAIHTFLTRMTNEEKGKGGKQKGKQGPPNYKLFPWIEVFKSGDWLEPHVHTGSPGCGLVCLRCGAEDLSDQQKLVFIDPRGKAAPFGRTHQEPIRQGQLFLFPSFAEHYVLPHRGNATNVVLNFLAWEEGGAPDFDWEDDQLGDYTYVTHKHITQKKDAEPDSAAKEKMLPKKEEL